MTGTDELRRVLGRFATGVTVVTAAVPDGAVGITVNSFTSVSLDPPMVLFCLASTSRARAVFRRGAHFAVNILSEDQEDVSRCFAARESGGNERFATVEVRVGVTGAPLLAECVAHLECEVVDEVEAGDHLIVIGRVIDLDIGRDHPPLVFFASRYARLADAPRIALSA